MELVDKIDNVLEWLHSNWRQFWKTKTNISTLRWEIIFRKYIEATKYSVIKARTIEGCLKTQTITT